MSDESARRGRGRPREIVRRQPGEGAPLNRRPADDQPTSSAILDAAQGILLREGAKGLTLVAVARQAHVDVTTVSYHFGSRGGLIEAVMDRLYADPTADFVEEVQELGDRVDRFHAYLRGVRHMYDDHAATRTYFEIIALALRDTSLRDRLARLHEWTAATFSKVIDPEADADSRALARLVHAAVDGIEMHHALIGKDYPIDAVLELLEQAVSSLTETDTPRTDPNTAG